MKYIISVLVLIGIISAQNLESPYSKWYGPALRVDRSGPYTHHITIFEDSMGRCYMATFDTGGNLALSCVKK